MRNLPVKAGVAGMRGEDACVAPVLFTPKHRPFPPWATQASPPHSAQPPPLRNYIAFLAFAKISSSERLFVFPR